MLYVFGPGYRATVARHGRPTQTSTGIEMDAHAPDVGELTDAPDLGGAIHAGHSTGGGVGLSHGMSTTHPVVVKADLLAFIKG